jgi:hypothetical protein
MPTASTLKCHLEYALKGLADAVCERRIINVTLEYARRANHGILVGSFKPQLQLSFKGGR